MEPVYKAVYIDHATGITMECTLDEDFIEDIDKIYIKFMLLGFELVSLDKLEGK